MSTTARNETPTLDRALGALLGLALGDAYGRPLEFVLLPAVRTAPVDLSAKGFRWTDDTHISLYLARAIEDQTGKAGLDQDALGRAVGTRFAEWAEDPLTPSTAPGGTCPEGEPRCRVGHPRHRSPPPRLGLGRNRGRVLGCRHRAGRAQRPSPAPLQ